MRKSILVIILLGLVVGGALVIFSWSGDKTVNRPTRSVLPLNLEAVESKFSVPVKAPHPPLQVASRQALPQFYRDNLGSDNCARTGQEAQDCYDSVFSASSDAVLLGLVADDGYYVTVPFTISGKTRLSDENTHNVSSAYRPFSAKIKAHTKVKFSIEPDWCIKATVTSNLQWTKDLNIKGRKTRADLKSQIEGKLTNLLRGMGERVAFTIQCNDLRDQVKDVWRIRSLPVAIPENRQKMYINIKPVSLGFSTLRLISDQIQFDLDVTAKTDITTNSIVSKPLPLPVPKVVIQHNNSIDFALYYQVSYRKAADALATSLVGQSLSSRTRFGTYSLSVKSIEAYPVRDQLAIGLLVHSDNSEEWFAKDKWIYMQVRPENSKTAGELHLSFQGLARGMDPGLSLAVKEVVVPVIEQASIASFKQLIENTKGSMTKALGKENLVRGMGEPSIDIRRTVLTGGTVLTEIMFRFATADKNE